ncbi:MAG: M20/M25/M40 family metallo-hydrolase [Anaerolineales bacterium]|jgi:acetylornithine deacetylase/succinyl-diaminopimelate desuccinylase-like protein
MIGLQVIQRTIDLAIQVQQIPAPTSREGQRAEFVRECFNQAHLVDITVDAVGNVLGRLPGRKSGAPMILSAHLDTVFPGGTELNLQQLPDQLRGPGIGDNSIGVAGLLGLIWALDERQVKLDSDLWLVANVGEEGLGNLRGMQEIVKRFAGSVRAYVILEGMALGQVYHRGLGVSRYRISVSTAGGHSWVDYGKPSAVHELTAIVSKLLEIQVSDSPRSTLNVGVISGGTTINTIAAEANIELDLRSEDLAVLRQLDHTVNAVIQNYRKPGVVVNVEMIGKRPAGEIPQDHPLVILASSCLEQVGIEPRLNIGSTDANIPLSFGYPAICLGLTTGGGAHTLGEYINIPPLSMGFEQLCLVVEGLDRSS